MPDQPEVLLTNEMEQALVALNESRAVTFVQPLYGVTLASCNDLRVLIAVAIRQLIREFPARPAWMATEDDDLPYRNFIHARATAIKPPRQEMDPEAFAFEVEQHMHSNTVWPEMWRRYMDWVVQQLQEARLPTLLVVPFVEISPDILSRVQTATRSFGHPNLVYLLDTSWAIAQPERPEAPRAERVEPPRPQNAWGRILLDDSFDTPASSRRPTMRPTDPRWKTASARTAGHDAPEDQSHPVWKATKAWTEKKYPRSVYDDGGDGDPDEFNDLIDKVQEPWRNAAKRVPRDKIPAILAEIKRNSIKHESAPAALDAIEKDTVKKLEEAQKALEDLWNAYWQGAHGIFDSAQDRW